MSKISALFVLLLFCFCTVKADSRSVCGDVADATLKDVKLIFSGYYGTSEFTDDLKADISANSEKIARFYLNSTMDFFEYARRNGLSDKEFKDSSCRQWILALSDFSSFISALKSRFEEHDNGNVNVLVEFFNRYLGAVLEGYR